MSGERHPLDVFNEATLVVGSRDKTPEFVAARRLLLAAPELLQACREQHEAIDILASMLMAVDPKFRLTQSGKPWLALCAGNRAVALATGECKSLCDGCGGVGLDLNRHGYCLDCSRLQDSY